MITLLAANDARPTADSLKAVLEEAYAGLSCEIVSPGTPRAPESWDDLLIVLFGASGLPPDAGGTIDAYLGASETRPWLLPLAFDRQRPIPPRPLSGVKALLWDADDPDVRDRVVRRVGAILGLRLRNRDTRIFISYRAADGRAIAQQLHDFLKEEGFRPWLDEARDEVDGEGSIPGGEKAQNVLEESLKEADLLLLLDTPRARESRWIGFEIETANGALVPILPLFFRASGERRQSPRFAALASLQRWVTLDLPAAEASGPLPEADLGRCLAEMETFLGEIYQRKLRLPHLVESIYRDHGFDWSPLDPGPQHFRSQKERQIRARRRRTEIISHCSFFDEIYIPAVHSFASFLADKSPNYRFFIYDAPDPVPEHEIDDLCGDVQRETGIDVVHHQELGDFLETA